MPPLSDPPPGGSGPDRREALRLLAAAMTAAAGGCAKPDEEIVPYVRMPERLVQGEPRRYATALPLAGYWRGVHAILVDGRPIKVEGNPLHPASLGATDVFAEAGLLDLYDPDRARAPTEREGGIASWKGFLKAWAGPLAAARARGGRGLRLLTGRVTSPTMLRQIEAWLAAMPEAVWHVHDGGDEALARAGAALAFGRPLVMRPRLADADVVVTLDADPLGPGPEQAALARALVGRRVAPPGAPAPASFLRLYAVEPAPTLTGLKADERLALAPAQLPAFAAALASAAGLDGVAGGDLSPEAARFAHAAAADLRARPGRALVLPGPGLPPETTALVHALNARLGAPVDWIAPVDRPTGREPGTLSDLADALGAGEVDLLAILESNPVHDAPPDLRFAERLGRARLSVAVGRYADETAVRCGWHIPNSHPLEAWSDGRAPDGTAGIVQPAIRPLHGTRSTHEILAVLAGGPAASGYDLVRETWRDRGGADFEGWWRGTLRDGVVPDSAAAIIDPGPPRPPPAAVSGSARSTDPKSGPAPAVRAADGTAADLAVVLRPDPCLWDGAFANNAWLQECPHPITKEVWGRALHLAPAEARRRGLMDGDVVRLAANGRDLEVPVALVPGHAPGTASLALGGGRTRAGAVGTGIGVNAGALASLASPRLIAASLAPTGRKVDRLATARAVRLEGETEKLFPRRTLADRAEPVTTGPEPPSLLHPWHGDADGHAWGMAIDTAACIGCNACVVACQSENNVPVVGPEEVARGRMMHWLRVDLYAGGTDAAPRAGFQPVPCMHCEHAPCEPVCPVAASVHDGEGLNVQVYNRCVGTRFCQANCPYKVRRFNFFGYSDGQEYARMGAETVKAGRNPNVTVRARGVMEKCTYCVQRIARARQDAERDGREGAPLEVVTACQSACPTRAITFGDLARGDSPLHAARADPRHYALLAELNTRPRTTYLADLHDPDPALAGDRS